MTPETTHNHRSKEQRLYARIQHKFANGVFSLDAELMLGAGVTVLFGASGAGKTTLLDSLAGLVRPDFGRIVLDGEVQFDSEQGVDVPTQQRRLGYLFQSPALFPHITVRQNVGYGVSHLTGSTRDKRVTSILEAFRVAPLADRKPSEISGGQAQRVALARALVTEPRLLLLDEPLGGLDTLTKSHILADLRAWNRQQNIPILLVTHDRSEVYALGERVIVLGDGAVIADGAPHEVLELTRSEAVAQLAGFENVFEAEVTALHPEQGTMTCRILPRIEDPALSLQAVFAPDIENVLIEAPLGHVRQGNRVKIAVRAGDVMVATEAPRGLSARNVFPAQITSIEKRDAWVAVSLLAGAGVSLESHVTLGAVRSLELREEKTVWVVTKTHSWRILG